MQRRSLLIRARVKCKDKMHFCQNPSRRHSLPRAPRKEEEEDLLQARIDLIHHLHIRESRPIHTRLLARGRQMHLVDSGRLFLRRAQSAT